MDERDFVWEHFKLNAEQRLSGFNFFVLLSIFADGGVFTALEKQMSPHLVVWLGFFICLLAVVFLLVDARSKQLLELTIPALKEIELGFPPSHQLFAIDASQRKGLVRHAARYTVAIRALLAAQFAFGLWVAYSALCRQ